MHVRVAKGPQIFDSRNVLGILELLIRLALCNFTALLSIRKACSRVYPDIAETFFRVPTLHADSLM